MYDLSILIPARNEQFISNTVSDILKNKRGKTEILVGLDGAWASPQIEDHPDVKIVHVSESRGQRGMTNTLAKLSKAKYLAKADAHTAYSEGFDIALMDDMQDNWTVAPLMKNLHAFDWKCRQCGKRTYQGPKPTSCEDCDNTTRFSQKIVFKPRHHTPNSTSYRFDANLHFQYFNEYKKIQDATNSHLVESMSLQGSFFMLTRKKYWELNICDESWGSWGQQGAEVALKTWLSGGRVVINKNCWYAHLFRTQPGFSFPYPQSGSGQQKARDICNDVFKNNKWDKQKYPLSWLLEKFWPQLQEVPDRSDNNDVKWTQADLDNLKKVPLAK